MKKSNGFQFKQFFIQHDRCAMKVNTDGILLGAIADIQHAKHILDLGTGSGLVALMLAQRTPAHCQITAIELEQNAFQQAIENAQHSAWATRIEVRQGDILAVDFAQKFDLIVANPPYFSDGLAAKSNARQLARTATQSHLSWLLQAKKWLTAQGKITFILPTETASKLLEHLPTSGLFCQQIYQIHTKPKQVAKRSIITFGLMPRQLKQYRLTIYNDQNQYTEEYKKLTQAFYLNM